LTHTPALAKVFEAAPTGSAELAKTTPLLGSKTMWGLGTLVL